MIIKFLISYITLLGLSTSIFASDIKCKGFDGKEFPVKSKTITIYNNSETMVYPVIATSKNAVNEWIQGCFRTNEPYPTNYVYKLYVNQDKGIPSGSSITITLPLYSKISADQYITWWNGGRVVLADKKNNLHDKKDTALSETPEGVACMGEKTECTLSFYSSDVQFPENIYAQLSEYTFGDSIIPPNENLRILKPENVGYNISYVDHVYMPIAIGPKNNPYIGFSGSVKTLESFKGLLENFLKTDIGDGWPVYNLGKLKLPGGYNIFAQRTGTLPPEDNVPVKPTQGFPPVLTVLKCLDGSCTEEEKTSLHFGQSVQRMQNLWGSCVAWDEDVSQYVTEKVNCSNSLKKNLDVIQRFFKKNHDQYVNMFNAGQCKMDKNIDKPVPFNYWTAITHIYGWVPFNEGCGAAANPLLNTTIDGWDHAKIQPMYIHDLQYNYQNITLSPEYLFNPYVKLIHSPDYLDMGAYGFSVDDAVGFMSELGDGLIFTVGGPEGLENKMPFNYEDGFSVAIGVPKSMEKNVNTPLIKKYGVCSLNQDPTNAQCDKVNQDVSMPENSQISGFRVGNVPSYPIKVSFTDTNNNVYTFIVNTKFAKCDSEDTSKCPTNRDGIVDKESCAVYINGDITKIHSKSREWCMNANPNQNKDKQITKNYLSFPQPVDYMP